MAVNNKYVYLIGIGGIGMSALARYFHFAGSIVSGYDKTPSPLTDNLRKEGIDIHFEDRPDLVPADIENTLIIYTPAVPEDLKELGYVMKNGYRVIKRSRSLGEIASEKCCLAIAGTHGKTTTSTILAHIMAHSGVGCTAFLGGISKNYKSNLLMSKSKYLVAEADEFDRSFLQLFPDSALITSNDPDHLDIYGDNKVFHEAFEAFAGQVSSNLVIKHGINIDAGKTKATIFRYSYNNTCCDFYASEIELLEGGYFSFVLNTPKGSIDNCSVGIPGWINVENAIGAAAIAMLGGGINLEQIRAALKEFRGVQRRFDLHINTLKVSYIDDYAHHPSEISAAISSIRNIFPGRKLCGIFQPHLYTRTRDFYKGFAESLSMLDELILTDIYPARELPVEGVSSHMILDNVTIDNKVLIRKEDILKTLDNRDIDILITMGAGDIDRYVPVITGYLEKRYDVKAIN